MTRLPILVRQSKVFDLVVQGKSYEQICTRLKCSEDTIARDMEAIAGQVQALIRDRNSEVLAVALAHYGEVVARAWEEYHADAKREAEWYAGKLDYPVTIRTTKTLEGPPELPPRGKEEEEDDELGSIGDFIKSLPGDDAPAPRPGPREQSLPLEVKTRSGLARPVFRSQRAQWLKLVIDATREITELTGIKLLLVRQTSDPVEHVHMTLDQWKAEREQRRAEAEATYRLLEDDDA